jgi:hypothetical protein
MTPSKDTQQNNIWHADNLHNGTKYGAPHHNDIEYNGAQHTRTYEQ